MALATYAATLCPTVGPGDSGELTLAAMKLGIAHPPGYAVFTWLGRLSTLLPFTESAVATNLLTALLAAGGVTLLFLMGRSMGLGRIAAASAALVLAFSDLYWQSATTHEVYALDALLLAAVMALVLRSSTRRPGRLLTAAFVFGLALGHRPTAALWLPSALLLLWPRRDLLRTRPFALALPAVLLLGFSSTLGILVRARAGPSIVWEDPSTLARFWQHIRATQYGDLAFSVPSEVLAGRLRALPGMLSTAMGIPALLAAAVGAFVLARRRRRELAALVMLLGTAAFGLVYNIPDFSSQFLPAVLALALLAGTGVDWIASRVRSLGPQVAIVLAALTTCYPLVSHLGPALRDRTTAVRDLGDNMLATLPEHSVLFFGDDVIGNAAGYASELRRTAESRAFVSAERLFSSLYWTQLRQTLDLPDHTATLAGAKDGGRDEAMQLLLAAVTRSTIGTRQVYLSPDLLRDAVFNGPLGRTYDIVPTGIVNRLVSKSEAPSQEDVLSRNAELWARYGLESLRRSYKREAFEGIQIVYAASRLNLAVYCHKRGWQSAYEEQFQAAQSLPSPAGFRALSERVRRLLERR